ncbi:DUF5777 family beta-barrel protein [Bacteroidia bacterium]|jgi:hypothetical protein|nr:DUF5777 family beta-barrel protein [Bacteroidia bacterium]
MKELKCISKALLISSAFFFTQQLHSQETVDLLAGMDEEEEEAYPVTNEFKTTQVINLPSLMMTDKGEFDLKINHRFNPLNSGAYDAYGFDVANIRIGGEYGITKGLVIGLGRSNVAKQTDAFLEYKLFNQTTDNKKPFTAILYAGSAYTAQKYSFTQSQSGRDIDFKSRLAYTAQLVLGRKISNSLSLQISPTILHYNTTKANTSDEKFDNTLMAVGIAARAKITTRTTFNAEWIPVIGNNGNYKNALSIGFDIETGGHVFQLHLTNSRGMSPYQYIGRNDQSWGDGGIHFGFNISRIFNIVNYEE